MTDFQLLYDIRHLADYAHQVNGAFRVQTIAITAPTGNLHLHTTVR